MKKQLKLIKIIIIPVICILCMPFTKATAPFGRCQQPILKKAPAKAPVKKIGDWSLIEEPQEVPLSEDTLLATIKETAFFAIDSENFESFNRWVNLLSCIYNWMEQSKSSAKKQYLKDLEQLYLISDFANLLAREFSDAKSHTDVQKNAWKETAQTMIHKLVAITASTLSIFEKTSDNSSAWKKTVPKPSELESLHRKYGNILDNKPTKESYDIYFKNYIANNVFSGKTLKSIVDDLEKIIYRYNHSYFHKSSEVALAQFCQKFLAYIQNHFGNGLFFSSDSYLDRFKNSKDIASKTILTISKELFDFFHKFITKISRN